MDQETVAQAVITWAPIYVTLLASFLQGAVLFGFFHWQRNRDIKNVKHELFEPRQFTRGHRSPPPFDGKGGLFGWAKAAWNVDDEQCLQYIGLDSFMFLRFLRLAARMTLVGVLLSIVLIPIYVTGNATGSATEAFNRITIARVEPGSDRLCATLICWFIYCAFILMELWKEWVLYAKHRYDFLAKGDMDTPPDFRYAIRVENIPRNMQSNTALHAYFEHLFPGQVRQAVICFNCSKLDDLIAKRQKLLIAYEKAVAFTKAKPLKPVPMTKNPNTGGVCGGSTKVEAIPYYAEEISRLNGEIDTERSSVFALAEGDAAIIQVVAEAEKAEAEATDEDPSNVEVGIGRNGNALIDGDEELQVQEYDLNSGMETDGKASSTGYVTFTTLRAKQAAVQCEISGQKDRMDTYPVSDPAGVIWENATVPITRQAFLETATNCFWVVGILFWAIPVTFVTSIANINGLLQGFGLKPVDPSVFWYGLVSGLLPVIFLAILMAVLYMAIVTVARKVIRLKSMPEVDSYTLFWHQLFQFANLWLILIGGSFFTQLDPILKDPSSILTIIAKAVPASSLFFVNMISVGAFGAFGMELSMLPVYGINLIMGLIQPEAQRTQRMLDDARKPPSLVWGKVLPKVVFVYFVSILYMPIVPIVQVFALIYFAGSYLTYKHQCLHVYATEFEGGGETTWQRLYGFLLGSIYMSQAVFIAYMGIKEASLLASLGFIPLIVTFALSYFLNRNIRQPLQNLSLEVAARVDEDEGEQSIEKDTVSFSAMMEKQLYGQPALKLSQDEREPLPYRREMTDVEAMTSMYSL